MATTIKLWTGELLLKLPPVVEFPREDLEVFDLVAKVGHILRRESIVLKVGQEACIRNESGCAYRGLRKGMGGEEGMTNDHSLRRVRQSPSRASRSASRRVYPWGQTRWKVLR